MSTNPITLEGKNKLEAELKQLKTKERPAVIVDIAEARAHGDLSENAEYHAAREKQGFIEGRIKHLEHKIATAQIIDPASIKVDHIVFGAKIEILDLETDEKKAYQIVGVDEADAKLGRLSIQTPIARALLRKKVGDVVQINVPKGELEYEILSIRYE